MAIKPEEDKPVPHATVTIKNIEAAKQLLKEFDEFQRFRLQVASEFFSKASDVTNLGTSFYEKLIVLNGATIALSVSFLGYLSSRIAGARVAEKPHVWMVAVSWFFLLASIYLTYHVLIARHGSTRRLLLKVSRAHTEYLYERLATLMSAIANVAEGKVYTGDEESELSTLLVNASGDTRQEAVKHIKKIEDEIDKDIAPEQSFARLAIWSTILGIGFLCVFTIRSLWLLF